jgi:hypothetical protein
MSRMRDLRHVEGTANVGPFLAIVVLVSYLH